MKAIIAASLLLVGLIVTVPAFSSANANSCCAPGNSCCTGQACCK